MSRIVILGGTGYAGGHLAAEAAQRGHDVLAVSRNEPADVTAGVDYRTGDVRDESFLQDVLTGADVVVAALSPRGDMADEAAFRKVASTVARIAQEQGIRFGTVGGAGSLRVAEGGPTLLESGAIPEEYAAEPAILAGVLQDLRDSDEALDWFFVSPAGGFGAFAPGERTGRYRSVATCS